MKASLRVISVHVNFGDSKKEWCLGIVAGHYEVNKMLPNVHHNKREGENVPPLKPITANKPLEFVGIDMVEFGCLKKEVVMLWSL